MYHTDHIGKKKIGWTGTWKLMYLKSDKLKTYFNT